MRKIHTRRRNMLMLTIMLLIFFLLDNILVSMSNYIIDRMQEHLDARTLIVEGVFYYSNPSKPEADAKSLEAYLADESETFSWISKESSAYFSYYESDEEFLFYTYGCDYEALKDYVLTKDCHAPEKNEVIIPQYYTDHENTIDIGSYILSFDELDRDEKTMDGEELVGQTITGTVGVFTAYGEYPKLNVKENLEMPMRINKKIKKSEYESRCRDLLALFGMEEYLFRYPDELSGGEQQRACIARALVNDPMVILADEPTGNLDEDNEKIVAEYLKSLTARDKTVIVVTHNEAVRAYADMVYNMRKGKMEEFFQINMK